MIIPVRARTGERMIGIETGSATYDLCKRTLCPHSVKIDQLLSNIR